MIRKRLVYPQWVKEIARTVNKWLGTPAIRDFFHRMLLEHGAALQDRLSRSMVKDGASVGLPSDGVGPPTIDASMVFGGDVKLEFLPRRPLHGPEAFWYLAAVREAVYPDADRLEPWENCGPSDLQHWLASVQFQNTVRMIDDLIPDDQTILVDALNDVADALKQPRPVISPADIVRIVPRVPYSDAKANGVDAKHGRSDDGRGGAGAGIHVGNGGTLVMGDQIPAKDSIVINGSNVQESFNESRDDHSTHQVAKATGIGDWLRDTLLMPLIVLVLGALLVWWIGIGP